MAVGMPMKCDIIRSDNSAQMTVHHHPCTMGIEDHGDCHSLSFCQMLNEEKGAVQASLLDSHQQMQETGR